MRRPSSPSRSAPKCSVTTGCCHVASSWSPGRTVCPSRPATNESMCHGCGSIAARGATSLLADRRPSSRAARALSSAVQATGRGRPPPSTPPLSRRPLLDAQPAGHRQALREAVGEVGGVDQWLGAPGHGGSRPLADLGRDEGEGGGVAPVLHAFDEDRELARAVACLGVATDPGAGAGQDRRDVVGDGLRDGVEQLDRRHVPQVGDHRCQRGVVDVVGAQRPRGRCTPGVKVAFMKRKGKLLS